MRNVFFLTLMYNLQLAPNFQYSITGMSFGELEQFKVLFPPKKYLKYKNHFFIYL
jgi:hypothetical protein